MTALASLCIELAPTAPELTRWGQDHAPLIGAQPEHVRQPIRARYAERLAVLKETR